MRKGLWETQCVYNEKCLLRLLFIAVTSCLIWEGQKILFFKSRMINRSQKASLLLLISSDSYVVFPSALFSRNFLFFYVCNKFLRSVLVILAWILFNFTFTLIYFSLFSPWLYACNNHGHHVILCILLQIPPNTFWNYETLSLIKLISSFRLLLQLW